MEIVQVPTLETERLLLRSFRPGDIDDYAALNADPEVLHYLGGGTEPWDRSRSWRHMAFLIGHWQFCGTGMWVLEHKETGEFIGVVGFSAPDGWPGFELAWILARRYWGHGYATEGALAALNCGFIDWHKERIISLIHPENRASIRVAERIGERLLDRINHLGRDMLCYGIDRETYLTQVAPHILRKPRPTQPTTSSARRFARALLQSTSALAFLRLPASVSSGCRPALMKEPRSIVAQA